MKSTKERLEKTRLNLMKIKIDRAIWFLTENKVCLAYRTLLESRKLFENWDKERGK